MNSSRHFYRGLHALSPVNSNRQQWRYKSRSTRLIELALVLTRCGASIGSVQPLIIMLAFIQPDSSETGRLTISPF